MGALAGLEGGAVGVAPRRPRRRPRASCVSTKCSGTCPGAGERVEQLGGADDVDHAVAGALGERLGGAGLRGEVDDGVGPQVGEHGVAGRRRWSRRRRRGRRESGRSAGGSRARVHLRVQVVEHDPLLGGVRELAREGRADEAGAARDEDATTCRSGGRHGQQPRCHAAEIGVSPGACADRLRPMTRGPQHGRPSHLRGLVEVGVASVLWGTGGLAVQLIREHDPLSAVTISTWRMTIAAVVLLVALVALRRLGELVDLARTAAAPAARRRRRHRGLPGLLLRLGDPGRRRRLDRRQPRPRAGAAHGRGVGAAPSRACARTAGGAGRGAHRAAAGRRRRARVVDRPGPGRRRPARGRVGDDVRPHDGCRRIDQQGVVAARARRAG